MKRLLVCVLILNALLVGDRILLTFAANPGTAPCANEIGDVDASGLIDINDGIVLLSSVILGDPPELVANCFALEVPDLEQRLADVEVLLASVDGRVASNEMGLSTVAGQVGGLDSRLTTAEGDVSDLAGQLATSGSALESLDGRVTTSEGAVTGLDTRLTTAEGTIASTDVAVAELHGRTTLSDLACADGEIAKTEGDE